MKVLTVWQPWAQLLAAGYKHNETRSWRTNYRGEILIHASKKPYSQTERLMTAKSRKLIRDTLGLGFIDWRQRIPTGVIIGKAKLTDCKLIDESYYQFTRDLCPEEFAYGDFTPGRYAWVFEEPELFKNPLPATGKQGLWNFDGSIWIHNGELYIKEAEHDRAEDAGNQ